MSWVSPTVDIESPKCELNNASVSASP